LAFGFHVAITRFSRQRNEPAINYFRAIVTSNRTYLPGKTRKVIDCSGVVYSVTHTNYRSFNSTYMSCTQSSISSFLQLLVHTHSFIISLVRLRNPQERFSRPILPYGGHNDEPVVDEADGVGMHS
jgi:hypothetical protein